MSYLNITDSKIPRTKILPYYHIFNVTPVTMLTCMPELHKTIYLKCILSCAAQINCYAYSLNCTHYVFYHDSSSFSTSIIEKYNNLIGVITIYIDMVRFMCYIHYVYYHNAIFSTLLQQQFEMSTVYSNNLQKRNLLAENIHNVPMVPMMIKPADNIS